MDGKKLALLKRAMCFVIENLGSSDRLSIVAFETNAQRVVPLSRMSDKGRQDARTAVNSLQASGSTDIVKGLLKGVRVLNERRHRNPVSSIILLSDGNDNHNYYPRSYSGMQAIYSDSERVVQYLKHLPCCICSSNSPNGDQGQNYSVHTFGFGNDSDSNAMHAIADAFGGTYSFIEAVQIVQEAFARCIGGLLSVVAQELRLMIRSASSGVIIGAIPSGRLSSAILDDGQRGMIGVGDVYADEEKQFLVYVSVPKSLDMEKETALLDIECSYKDPMYTAAVKTDGKRVTVRRPEAPSDGDKSVCLEVDQQRNRVLVAEAISEAQKLADSGNLEGAKLVLAEKESTLLSSASAKAGNGLCNWLQAELEVVREKMSNLNIYRTEGRSFALAGISAHAMQRATTGYANEVRAGCSRSAPAAGCPRFLIRAAGCTPPPPLPSLSALPLHILEAYETDSMKSMVKKANGVNDCQAPPRPPPPLSTAPPPTTAPPPLLSQSASSLRNLEAHETTSIKSMVKKANRVNCCLAPPPPPPLPPPRRPLTAAPLSLPSESERPLGNFKAHGISRTKNMVKKANGVDGRLLSP